MQKKFLLFCAVFFILSTFTFSQSFQTKFEYAQELALQGKREAAIDSLKKIISAYPNEIDAQIFLGKVYGWNKEYDNAREIFFKVIRKDETNIEAYKNLVDIEVVEKNYSDIIRYTSFALEHEPYNEDILFNRVYALVELKRFDEGGEYLNKLIEINPANSQYGKLINLLVSTNLANKAGVSYNIEIFEDIKPWHYAAVDYSRKFSFGNIGAGVSYANSMDKFGLQFFADADIILFQNSYLNLGTTFSKDDMFPKYSFSIEPYLKLVPNFSLSLGYRNLNSDIEKVDIFTAHIGKYWGSYFISARPYFAPKREQTKFSGLFSVKRFFSDTENYIMLMLGYGFIPLTDFSSFEYTRSISQKAALLYKVKATRILNLSFGLMYELEEIRKEDFRSKYNVELGIQTLF